MAISYISTRGTAPSLPFAETALAGLASDGGLYVPATIPTFAPQEVAALQGLPYPALAQKIMAPFMGNAISASALSKLLEETYDTFRHPAVAPLTQVDTRHFIMELFHGPTLAFKDFALQFVGRLIEALLAGKHETVTVIGATSGDTGSAAIAGFAGRSKARIFILHPHGKVSAVQRRQMTTVADANVHNIAVEGTFDDCQDIVKALFADESLRAKQRLVAVNSINWARIMAQIVYYFYAGLALGAPARRVTFSVPTGNFGDIFAGYIAKKMGLPMGKLIIATNRNDILARCLTTGTYRMEGVHASLSPSMDIQISSNFERLLFDLYGRDGKSITDLMARLRKDKAFTLKSAQLKPLRHDFASFTADDKMTLATIAGIHRDTGLVIDPHTAVGVAAAKAFLAKDEDLATPVVTLATAHPAKFPEAVAKACGVTPALPPHMEALMTRKERFTVLPNSVEAIKKHIESHP